MTWKSFPRSPMPWEQADAGLFNRIAFGGYAHQFGNLVAFRMWRHSERMIEIDATFPDPVDNEAAVDAFLSSLDRAERLNFALFWRGLQALARNYVRKSNRGALHTYGLLPMMEPIDPRPVSNPDGDLPF